LISYFQYFIYLIGGADAGPVPEEDLVFAQEIIEFWVTEFLHQTNGMGNKPMVHFLLHIVQDCRFHKCHYDVLSVFKYENDMRFLRPMVKSGHYKLEQLRNRLAEVSKYVYNRNPIDGRIERNANGDLSMGWGDCGGDGSQMSSQQKPKFIFKEGKYQCLLFAGMEVSTAIWNSFLLIDDSNGNGLRRIKIFQLVKILEDKRDKKLTLCGHIFLRVSSLFQAPAESMKKHVYAFSSKSLQESFFSVSTIVGKLYAVPRFQKLPLQRCTDEILGVSDDDEVDEEKKKVNFSNVKEWVGIAERHAIGPFGDASLY
jgi:hypothetical protein